MPATPTDARAPGPTEPADAAPAAPRCIGCGYDLAGLAPDARCPECGVEVGLSTGAISLDTADPAWRRRVGRGLRLAGAGVALAAVWTALVLVALGVVLLDVWLTRDSWRRGLWIGPVAGVGAAAVLPMLLVGGWLATAREPGEGLSDRAGGGRLRRTARWCVALGLPALVLAGAAWAVHSFTGPNAATLSGFLIHVADAGLLAAAGFLGAAALVGCRYAERLARRTPGSRPPGRPRRLVLGPGLDAAALRAVAVSFAAAAGFVLANYVWHMVERGWVRVPPWLALTVQAAGWTLFGAGVLAALWLWFALGVAMRRTGRAVREVSGRKAAGPDAEIPPAPGRPAP